MWRVGFLVLASCSLIPVSSANPADGEGRTASPVDPEASIPMGTYDKVPAKAPATLGPPDAPAPPIVSSKGPFSQRGSHVGGLNVFLPVSQEPASPWAGVSKGHPVKLDIKFERWWIRDESIACTAARDHCLPAASWFWIKNVVEASTLKNGYPVVFTTDGPKRPAPLANGDKPAYTAYRSVPATKKNLVAGARVFAFPDQPVPTGTDGVYDRWQTGIVDRVDWDLGMLFFKEMEQPFFITAARVAVLSYEPDAGVKILDGKKRDELAVKAADLVLP
jgi:hypothetical protein